jgi:hypothetical protein
LYLYAEITRTFFFGKRGGVVLTSICCRLSRLVEITNKTFLCKRHA